MDVPVRRQVVASKEPRLRVDPVLDKLAVDRNGDALHRRRTDAAIRDAECEAFVPPVGAQDEVRPHLRADLLALEVDVVRRRRERDEADEAADERGEKIAVAAAGFGVGGVVVGHGRRA